MDEKTNNGDLEERIRVGRICQDLVQVKERALCGFGAFGKIINLSLIRCMQKEKDKRYMNMPSGWDAHFNRPLNALTFSSSGIFLKSDPEMRTQRFGEKVVYLYLWFCPPKPSFLLRPPSDSRQPQYPVHQGSSAARKG